MCQSSHATELLSFGGRQRIAPSGTASTIRSIVGVRSASASQTNVACGVMAVLCGVASEAAELERREQRGVPDDFPEVSVRVLEVAGVAAPERVARLLDDRRVRALGAGHHGVDLGL